LASKNQANELSNIVLEQIMLLEPMDDEELPELNLLNPRILFDWEEGVEDLSVMSSDQLQATMGLDNKHVPYFNKIYDRTGLHNPWEHKEWFEQHKETEDVDVLNPRWHQQVGILKIIQQAFNQKSTLLMDDVGLGKTMQITGVIAMLAYFRDYFSHHKKYPGGFGLLFCQGSESRLLIC
jgi:hypothetical protein